MTRSKYVTFVTRKAVSNAWTDFWKVSKNQTASGIDGITPQKFAASSEKYIDGIHKDLKKGFDFSPLKPFVLEKSDGKKRIICIATVRDRVVQRMLADYLTARADRLGIINEASFGFIKSSAGVERGVIAARNKAVEYRQSYQWAYKTDISAFFDNIPRDKLIDITVAALRAESFRPILKAAASCEIANGDQAMNRLIANNGIVPGLGLRQGMPLSPLFSNIILREFDTAMLSRGYKMVRYADDLIVLSKTKNNCEEIDRFVREILSKINLSVPTFAEKTKTEIAAPDERIDFLGLSLQRTSADKYGLILTSDHLLRIKRKLGEFKDVQRLVKQGSNFIRLGHKIENAVGGYRSAYSCADNFDELDRHLDHLKTDVIRSVLINIFGVKSVDGLNKLSRVFMGIESGGAH